MTLPIMKKKVALCDVFESQRTIYFYGDDDVVTALRAFGDVNSAGKTNYHQLIIDARFDFKEVIAYIESLNE